MGSPARRVMIHVGVGHSQSISTVEAAERATLMAMGNAGIAKADLAIVFATINYQTEYGDLYKAVQTNSNCDELIGCSGMSVLTSAGEFEEEPALAVMVIRSEQLSAVSFSAQGSASEVVEQIQKDIQAELGDDSLLVIFPDVRAVNPAELVKHIGDDGAELPVVGAAVSGDATGAQMYHWKGEEATEGGLTGILLKGNFSTEIGVAQGCQPIGRPREVTRAEGRVILNWMVNPHWKTLKAHYSCSPKKIFVGQAAQFSSGSQWTLRTKIRSAVIF